MSGDESYTTLEKASRCSKCDQPGRWTGDRNLETGSGKLKMFMCENSRCSWYNTEWPVQVASNGTIPITLRRPKSFAALPDDGGRTLEAIESQLGVETKAGAELNRRY